MSNNRLYAELKFMESLSIFCLTLLCLFVLIFMQSDRNLGLDDILKKELMEKMQLIIWLIIKKFPTVPSLRQIFFT